MLQVRISLFLIIFINDAVRHDLEKARTIDGTRIRETQVGISMDTVFGMETRQYIRIVLVSFRINIAGKFQYISLIRMLDTHPGDQFPFLQGILHHSISGTDLFRCIVIQRVPYVAIRTGDELYLVKIKPVLIDILRILGTGSRVERIFIKETVTLLIPVHTSGREIQDRPAIQFQLICQIDISGFVLIRVMFPTTFGRIRSRHVGTQQIYFRIIGRFAECFGQDSRPVQPQRSARQKQMFAF